MSASAVTYEKADSVKVVRLLEKGIAVKDKHNLHMFFAEQLKGIPYVAATLEVNKEEQLVVNLRELDCTTYVETAIALAMTAKEGSTSFDDYCKNLILVRYSGGVLTDYSSRNHYFSGWIQSNERQGFVKEIQKASSPFVATQHVHVDFMTKHTQYYPMLKDDVAMQKKISVQEQAVSGATLRYIPRAQLKKSKQTDMSVVKDGDILAIVTKKEGLDTSHIGFAKWGSDGKLHLLNASQIHKKVVLEPMTLFDYMGKHPSQLGVRVIRVTP